MARGVWEAAEGTLREALAVAEAIGNPPQLWKTHAALGGLLDARGRPAEAHHAHCLAAGVVERVQAGLHDPDLRASLEGDRAIQRIRALAGG